jgi:SAM-dependent methyltransferase
LPNPWSNPDLLPQDEALGLARIIDKRAELPDQRQAHDALVAALAPKPGERLLDMGCGTGIIARRLATSMAESGEVIGVDISRTMVEFARQCPTPPNLRYERADGGALPFADSAFDGASMARTLMHAEHPHELLVELCRVIRPGGRLVVLEADWGTVAVDHSDRPLTRRIVDWRTDTVDGDNWMGRQVPGRCLAAGWHVSEVRVLVTMGRDDRTTHFGSLRRCGELALQHGVITQAEHDGWVGELDVRLSTGRFFATMNETIVVVVRPDRD